MLLRVPMVSSSPEYPVTVTNPRFAGCLNYLWLLRIRTKYQPSASSHRMTSLAFMAGTHIHYIPVHNDQAQPRRVSGVGWSDWLGVVFSLQSTITPEPFFNSGRLNTKPFLLMGTVLEMIVCTLFRLERSAFGFVLVSGGNSDISRIAAFQIRVQTPFRRISRIADLHPRAGLFPE